MRDRIMQIGSAQRGILLVVLSYLIATAVVVLAPDSPAVELGSSAASLILMIVGLVSAVRLANALHGKSTAILTAILLLIPLANLIALFSLNRDATYELRRAGIEPGLLGVSSNRLHDWALNDAVRPGA
jgi:hypothetical protein